MGTLLLKVLIRKSRVKCGVLGGERYNLLIAILSSFGPRSVRSKWTSDESSTADPKVILGATRKGPSKGALDPVWTQLPIISSVTILSTWWRATRGSNPGPLVPETNALSTELVAHHHSNDFGHDSLSNSDSM